MFRGFNHHLFCDINLILGSSTDADVVCVCVIWRCRRGCCQFLKCWHKQGFAGEQTDGRRNRQIIVARHLISYQESHHYHRHLHHHYQWRSRSRHHIFLICIHNLKATVSPPLSFPFRNITMRFLFYQVNLPLYIHQWGEKQRRIAWAAGLN